MDPGTAESILGRITAFFMKVQGIMDHCYMHILETYILASQNLRGIGTGFMRFNLRTLGSTSGGGA